MKSGDELVVDLKEVQSYARDNCHFCEDLASDYADISVDSIGSQAGFSSVVTRTKDGVDGVLVTGCHIGDCHYLKGNEYAKERIERYQKVLRMMGLEKRFKLEWVSASEGKRFSELITEFSEKIKRLGPLIQ